MAEQNANNWLKPFRDKAKPSITQECLANCPGINRDKKTVQRWERYETVNNIPFDIIAKALQANVQELKNAHQKGLVQHKLQVIPINTGLIDKALKDCEAMGLTSQIMTEINVETIDDAVEKITGWLKEGKMEPFARHFNQLMKTAVASVGHEQIEDLDLIAQWVAHIALAATIPHDAEEQGNHRSYNLFGIKQAWTIRLAINASFNFSIIGISAISSTRLKGAGGIQIQEPTDDKVWQVAHKIIKDLVEELFLEKEPFPELIESEGHQNLQEQNEYPDFRKYCQERVEAGIFNANYEEGHCFLYTLHQEPVLVQQRLVKLIPSLRIFICSDVDQASPTLRLKESQLEAWIANALFAIQMRRQAIKQNIPPEEPKMKPENNPSPSINIITTVGDNATTAVDKSTAIKVNEPLEKGQLVELLNRILAETDHTTAEHRQLRGDVKEILSPLDKNEEVPKEGKSWLQDGLEKLKPAANLKTGTGLITLLEKAVSLYDKI